MGHVLEVAGDTRRACWRWWKSCGGGDMGRVLEVSEGLGHLRDDTLYAGSGGGNHL